MRSITALRELFEDELKSIHFSGAPKELYEPFSYMLGLGGKRMRPVMLLHAAEMFGADATSAMPQALAIELFHNFTLIHDDIMDNAPLRRGLPTVHKKFNSPVAILSGDAMLVTAYKYLVQSEPSVLARLINIFNDCAIKVCEGQQLDMNFETAETLDAAGYLNMIELKTATLIASSLKIGAMIGGASAEDAEHLYNFGKHLGISFQLKDDWLDSFGSAAKFGKQPGGDIIQNKKTFLLIEAMNSVDEVLKPELQYWYRQQQFDPQVKVAAVVRIFNELGISELTQLETAKHFDKSMEHIEQLSLPESHKTGLRQLSHNLLHRES
ncbi:MAG: polyprenyl synthetase family protein [Chitinophagales bacterium]